MFTIIGGDGKEYGPATIDQIRAWIAGGRANLETQARRAGESEWRRLGDFAEFTESSASPPPVVETAPSPEEEPVFTDVKTYADELFARSGKLDIGSCMERSWELYKANFWPLVGVTLLITCVQMVIGFIPFIGSVAGVLLKGVILGGLYFYYIGRLRHEQREVGDAFAGFSNAFGPLLIASLLMFVIILAVMSILAGPVFFGLIKGFIAMQHTGVPPEFHFTPLASLGMLVAGVIIAYLSVSWLFAFALIIDKRVGAWSAMEISRRVIARNWFRVLAVAILGTILMFLGLFALVIGIFFTMPLYYGAILSAYEALCNPPARARFTAPSTTPDA